MKEIWEKHDKLIEITPKRSHYWGLDKAVEEAEEWRITDWEVNEDQFLEEGADLVIAYLTVMKSSGYSMEVAMQAIMNKLDVVIDRAERATVMEIENGLGWDRNYQKVKEIDRQY
jgi:hypothetical protein